MSGQRSPSEHRPVVHNDNRPVVVNIALMAYKRDIDLWPDIPAALPAWVSALHFSHTSRMRESSAWKHALVIHFCLLRHGNTYAYWYCEVV